MHIIFGYVSYWQVPILRLLNYFKFKIFYLHIDAKTKIKKYEIATKLKNKNIYPLPIELEKKIFSESNYFINDPQEFTYRKNTKLIPDKIIRKYCELFSIDETKKIKLRLLLQDFIGNKQFFVGSLLSTWASLYELKKILYVSFKFNCFYVPDSRKNILKIIIPLDIFYYLTINLRKIFSIFLGLEKKINENHKNQIFNSHSFKEFEKKNVAFIVHKGLIYGTKDHILFEKKLYYSDDKNSCLNKYNILHLDYENFPSTEKNLNWLCLKKVKVSRTKIFLKTLSASIRTCYLIQSWSKFLGWVLCIRQYNSYLRYCEVIKRFKNLKLALIDYADLCPKTLLLALEKNRIKTIATQDRFITTFRPIFHNVTVDTYFVASEYVANYMEKSKKYDVNNIRPTGQYRCDYITSYKKRIVPKEILRAKEHGKKIIIALGWKSPEYWFESYINPFLNWSAQIIFLEDIIKLSKLLNNTFIILRYKELGWITNSHFKEILNKINECENIIISDNYKEADYAYKLCANADLLIAKHTSIADECLANEIPVLFHEYTHNTKNYISYTFDYLSSKLMCYNFDELLERSKSLLFNNSSQLKNEISTLNKTIYNVKEKGNVKNKIIKQLENLISEESQLMRFTK